MAQAGKSMPCIRSAGNLTRAVVPLPGSLSISSLPPCNSASDMARGTPRPVPCWLRFLALST